MVALKLLRGQHTIDIDASSGRPPSSPSCATRASSRYVAHGMLADRRALPGHGVARREGPSLPGSSAARLTVSRNRSGDAGRVADGAGTFAHTKGLVHRDVKAEATVFIIPGGRRRRKLVDLQASPHIPGTSRA